MVSRCRKYRVNVDTFWSDYIQMIDWCYANCVWRDWDITKEKQTFGSWQLTKEHWLSRINMNNKINVDFFFTSKDSVLHFVLTFGGEAVDQEEKYSIKTKSRKPERQAI